MERMNLITKNEVIRIGDIAKLISSNSEPIDVRITGAKDNIVYYRHLLTNRIIRLDQNICGVEAREEIYNNQEIMKTRKYESKLTNKGDTITDAMDRSVKARVDFKEYVGSKGPIQKEYTGWLVSNNILKRSVAVWLHFMLGYLLVLGIVMIPTVIFIALMG